MKKIACLLFVTIVCMKANCQVMENLSGEWEFAIDRTDIGKAEHWENKSLPDRIQLPGSMPERLKGDDVTVDTKWIASLYDSSYFYNPAMEKYRQPGNMKLTFFLTPEKHYVGVAWYRKNVDLFLLDKKKHRYVVFLERPHIQTTLYVNGVEVGTDRSLCVPHEYDVTDYIQEGENTLVLRIDNRLETVNVGQDSHSVTDQTQGDWNGVVGRMELREIPALHIADIQLYPFPDEHRVHVKARIDGKMQRDSKLYINIEPAFQVLRVYRQSNSVSFGTFEFAKDNKDSRMIEGDVKIYSKVELWDEFNPKLYKAIATISDKKTNKVDQKEVNIGFRQIGIQGKMFYVNNKKIQLRGTVENCDFPLTGYAPMDKNSWMNIFKQCKAYGLNHMRFHSYCPPEAAFEAADEMGFYLQPEGPSWPNHGVKLGYGDDIDTYLMEETQRMVQAYGNHPSFCMMACGNEPAGRWVEWVSNFVDYWKQTDPRRVYTGASVGGGWAWQPKSQYHVKAGARGLGEWQRRHPDTMDDFRQQISHYKAKDMETDINEPYVSHETGQWCAFPNFKEIDKYTGVYKAKNFEVFKDILEEHDMGEMADKFHMASGKLQALCYKYEIEKTLRTPDYAGFQLLSINDYSGQGTALVGVSDVFFSPKSYMNPYQFKDFCSPVVPLARIPKFTYKNTETFTASIELNQYSGKAIQDVTPHYWIYTINDRHFTPGNHDGESKLLAEGDLTHGDFPSGEKIELGEVKVPLSKVKEPSRLYLRVGIPKVGYSNEWNFWVYPEKVDTDAGDVYITDSLDTKSWQVLEKGGKVLIAAGKNVSYGKEVVQYFTPVFWNTSWFKMRPPHTTGIYVDNTHSILENFPTDYHSDLQWWELVNKAPVMQFDHFPKGFQPIVQSIDTWFLSRKIGMLYEANVLNGRLVMTTMDITSDLDNRIVARQMRSSILRYMNSDKFKPKYTVDPQVISDLFTKEAPKIDLYTKDSPDELKPKLK